MGARGAFANPEYARYIRSSSWKWLRRQRLELDGYQCQACGSARFLTVHHLNYKHPLGQETMIDLLTLCRRCHATQHSERPKWNGGPSKAKKRRRRANKVVAKARMRARGLAADNWQRAKNRMVQGMGDIRQAIIDSLRRHHETPPAQVQ